MRQPNGFATISDLLHAVVIFGVLAVTAAGVSGELSIGSDVALAPTSQFNSSAAPGREV